MKQSKRKAKDNSKIISNIALIVFFAATILYIIIALFNPKVEFENLINLLVEGVIFITNTLLINRYIGLALAIYSYVKYRSKYSLIIMIICIVLQVISLICFGYLITNFDFRIDG